MNAAAWPPFEPTAAQRHRRVRRRLSRARVERGDRGGAAQRVPVGRAVELDRLADDARSRRGRRVDLQVRVRERAAGRREPEQPGELCVRAQGDQVPARIDPVGQHRHLGRRKAHLAQENNVDACQGCGADERDVGDGELVQALGAEDLRRIAAERIRRVADDQDRRARVRGRGRRGQRGREQRSEHEQEQYAPAQDVEPRRRFPHRRPLLVFDRSCAQKGRRTLQPPLQGRSTAAMGHSVGVRAGLTSRTSRFRPLGELAAAGAAAYFEAEHELQRAGAPVAEQHAHESGPHRHGSIISRRACFSHSPMLG